MNNILERVEVEEGHWVFDIMCIQIIEVLN